MSCAGSARMQRASLMSRSDLTEEQPRQLWDSTALSGFDIFYRFPQIHSYRQDASADTCHVERCQVVCQTDRSTLSELTLQCGHAAQMTLLDQISDKFVGPVMVSLILRSVRRDIQCSQCDKPRNRENDPQSLPSIELHVFSLIHNQKRTEP